MTPRNTAPPLFIVDENMGPSVVDVIVNAGGRAVLLTNCVEPGTEDVDFIPKLSSWGDAFLTRDVSMKSNEAERSALATCDVHVFLIRGGGLKLEELQHLIAVAAMQRYATKYAKPFLGRVTWMGVDVLTKSVERVA